MNKLILLIFLTGGVFLMGALCIMHFSFNPLMASNYSYTNGAMINYGGTPLIHSKAFASSDIMPSIPDISCDAHIKALSEITMSLTSSPPGSTMHPPCAQPHKA